MQAVSNKEHALVEFAEVASAVRAVRELTDDKNWRSGLRVKHMLAVPPGSKEAKLAAAKQKATLKAAKLLEELQLQAEGAEGGTPAGASGADEGGAVEAGEVKAAKARQTREEVEALVAAGKLYATVRTQLCKAFSQVWMPHDISFTVTFCVKGFSGRRLQISGMFRGSRTGK
jgi:hypothetical protein